MPTNRFGNPGPEFTQGNTSPYREMILANQAVLEKTRDTLLSSLRTLEIKVAAMNEVILDLEMSLKKSKALLK